MRLIYIPIQSSSQYTRSFKTDLSPGKKKRNFKPHNFPPRVGKIPQNYTPLLFISMTLQSKRYIQILDNIPTSIKSPNFHFIFKKPMLKIKRMRVWKIHIHISGTVNASPIAILVYVQRRSKEGKEAREAREKDERGRS